MESIINKLKVMKKRYLILLGLLFLGLLINFTFLSTGQLKKTPPLTPLSPEEEAEREFANEGILGEYNVLLLGIDSRTDRGLQAEVEAKSFRTDTIILASLDIKTKKARLISIPRDTRVKIKGNYNKINAAFVYGGINLAKTTVEDFMGVEIDRTMIVDFQSLVKLVDLLGGVKIDVPTRMYRPVDEIDLEPGLQLLDGHNALAYSRYRGTPGGDIDRAARQQEVIQALLKEIISVKGVSMIPSLYKTMEENMVTDIPLREIMTLGKLAPSILKNGLDTLVVPGYNIGVGGVSYWQVDEKAFIEAIDPDGTLGFKPHVEAAPTPLPKPKPEPDADADVDADADADADANADSNHDTPASPDLAGSTSSSSDSPGPSSDLNTSWSANYRSDSPGPEPNN